MRDSYRSPLVVLPHVNTETGNLPVAVAVDVLRLKVTPESSLVSAINVIETPRSAACRSSSKTSRTRCVAKDTIRSTSSESRIRSRRTSDVRRTGNCFVFGPVHTRLMESKPRMSSATSATARKARSQFSSRQPWVIGSLGVADLGRMAPRGR